MDDIELTNRMRHGDSEAAREVVLRYYPSVLRFLAGLCRNPDDAEELTQETFLKAFKHIGRFRGDSGLRTWLHRLAFHEYTHRRRRLRPSVQLNDDAISSLFEANSILALDLERALSRVPENLRAAYLLCDVQELTMNEAAAVLRVPSGTVKSRLHAARNQLQALLGSEQEVKINVSAIP